MTWRECRQLPADLPAARIRLGVRYRGKWEEWTPADTRDVLRLVDRYSLRAIAALKSCSTARVQAVLSQARETGAQAQQTPNEKTPA